MKTRSLVAGFVLVAAWLSATNAHALLDDQTCGTLDALPAVGGLLRTVDDAATAVDVCDREPDPDPTVSPDPDPVTRRPRGRVEPAAGAQTAAPPALGPAAQPVAQQQPQPAADGADDPVPGDEPARLGDAIPAGAGGVAVWWVLVAILVALVAGLIVGRRRAHDDAQRRADLTIGGALGSLPEAVIWAGPDGRIRSINPAAEAMLEMTAIAARGRTIWGVIDGTADDGATLSRWIRSAQPPAATTGTVGHGSIPVALTLADAGGDGAVLVARDLRPEHELAHMKEAFLSNVGHELRTPLTSALGFARMMRHRALSPEQTSSFLDAIVDACERLDHVIDLLIDVTALDGGQLKPDAEPVAIGSVLESVAERARAQYRRHVFSVDADPSVTVRGSEGLIRQALAELVDNAVKFSPDGGLVSLAAQVTGRGDTRTVAVRVSDQGVGMPQGRVEQMMDDFQQGDPSATRHFGGLGIGLGFVRRVIVAHGGSVAFASVPDEGTTVTVSLPAATTSRRGARVSRGRGKVRSARVLGS